jgi:NitT/TauT family transport system permease protein
VPVFTFVGIILLWAIIVWAFNIPQYLLPSPVAVFKELVTSWGLIWDNTLTTLLEIALGFVIAIVIAIPLGLLIALSMPARQILYPPVVVLQLVPKIAIAPLFIIWLGLGIDSKVLLTVLMSFFPLLISSISGFQILDTRLLYLTRSMGASQWETFRFLRFPAALPVIFAGLKTSATIAVTAALVAEFVGSTKGLGYLLLQATNTLNVPQVFAVLVVLTVIGIVLNYLVEFAEWLLTPWQRVKYN